MIARLKEIQNNLKNNPEFQANLEKMRPKKSFWGFLLILLFFFLPEVINILWYREINAWVMAFLENAPVTPINGLLGWAVEKSFDGELSLINLGLGIAFLVWMFRGR